MKNANANVISFAFIYENRQHFELCRNIYFYIRHRKIFFCKWFVFNKKMKVKLILL